MINAVNILDHISVTVSDMDRSLAFYCDLLGLEEVERHRLEGVTISEMHPIRQGLCSTCSNKSSPKANYLTRNWAMSVTRTSASVCRS